MATFDSIHIPCQSPGLTHLKIHFLCDSLLYMPYKPISSLTSALHDNQTFDSRVREDTKITDGDDCWLALEELGGGLMLARL